MRHVPLYFSFLLALLATLLGSAFFPFVHLSFFAPFLALTYHAAAFSKAVWLALCCGLILDLLSSEFRFGLYTLAWVLTTLLIYTQKKHFFEDKPIGLSLFTSVLAAVSTFLLLILVHLFDRGIPFSALTVFLDGVLMSLVDGLYAFLWFTCPLRLYTTIKKAGWRRLLCKAQVDEE